MNSNFYKVGPAQGWQCPVCGNILSPWTSMCPCHGQPGWTTTTTSDECSNIKLSDPPSETIEFNTYYNSGDKKE